MTSLSDRTAQCRHCVKHTQYQPYLAFFSHAHPATRAQYCPRCARQCPIAAPDYADTLCLDNAGLTRSQALSAITTIANRNASARSERSYQYVEDYLAKEHDLKNWPSIRSLTTPLSISCRDCGGSYVFYRNAPDIQRTPPLYCTWCGSSSTTISQLETEDSAWITLAMHYDIDVPTLRIIYDLWTTRSPLPTFAAFMASEPVSKVLSIKRAKLTVEAI